MGAGCHYTLDADSSIKAYWINFINEELETDNFLYDDMIRTISECLAELPLCESTGHYELDYGTFFKIKLESTYYGDGIIINVDENINRIHENSFSLVLSNLDKIYNKIAKHLNKYFELSIATSGYTSTTIALNTLK